MALTSLQRHICQLLAERRELNGSGVRTAPGPTAGWHLFNVVCLTITAAMFIKMGQGMRRVDAPPIVERVLVAAGAFATYFVVIWRVFRRAPSATAVTGSNGSRVVGFAVWRRLMIQMIALSVIIGPFLQSELDRKSLIAAIPVALLLAIGFMATGERYRFTDEWIERTGGLRPRRRWEWAKIRSVVELPGGVFLTDDSGRDLAISSRFFEGYREFMAKVLTRVRPEACPEDAEDGPHAEPG